MDRYDNAQKLSLLLDCAESGIQVKDIEGYEGKYAITSDGQVWSYWANGFIALADNGQGYLFVQLSKDGKQNKRRIHRLVAEAFLPKPDWWAPGMKIDVGHKDDNPNNNELSNLYWCTRSENLDTDHFREAASKKIFSQVRCVETGEVYKSIKAAGEAIGKHPYGINLCLLGKQQTCGGYHWERLFEN